MKNEHPAPPAETRYSDFLDRVTEYLKGEPDGFEFDTLHLMINLGNGDIADRDMLDLHFSILDRIEGNGWHAECTEPYAVVGMPYVVGFRLLKK